MTDKEAIAQMDAQIFDSFKSEFEHIVRRALEYAGAGHITLAWRDGREVINQFNSRCDDSQRMLGRLRENDVRIAELEAQVAALTGAKE